MKKLILLLTILFLTSCLSENEVRQVKIGMTTEELIKTLDDEEPWSIEIEPDHEKWYYTYYTGGNGRKNGLCIYIRNNKVINFHSY